MLGQVLADARQVDDGRDAVLVQLLGRPDPRQHQQLGGIVGPPGQDHLALSVDLVQGALVRELHPAGPPVLDQDPCRQRVGLQVQVGPAQRRVDIGAIGRRAPAALVDGHFALGEAFRMLS